MEKTLYNVIVVGGGHAGYEAALSSSRMGVSTLLITINNKYIGRLPCNPSIGGIAKSHIVSELDALGGEQARATDYTGVQFRTLNTRKGPAVQATRVQCDKDIFPARIQHVIKLQDHLEVLEDLVQEVWTENGTLRGVITRSAGQIKAKSVVIATGTFLCGRVLIGMECIRQGRVGEESADELSQSLRQLGFELGRMKTGTPPRLHKDSLDYTKMEIQPGDDPAPFFSRLARKEWKMFRVEQQTDLPNIGKEKKKMFHMEHPELHPWFPGANQLPCYLTHTNEKTHQIIADNLGKSSMYGGLVEGTGVRYCPSIEDKIVKFSGRNAHHVFVEPEGRENIRIYPNGTSNSLPEEIQKDMIHSIAGMERAELIRPGYAIEYDYAPPTQLLHTMETKRVENLYFAGQINGTTGYEEAAGQGFVAGVNAARKNLGLEPFVLNRNEAYIGVLIDDLVTKGTDEPYRMFTSRSEHRLTLRQDNVYFRLLERAKDLGIVTEEEIREISKDWKQIQQEIQRLENTHTDGTSLAKLLCRQGMNYQMLPGKVDGLDSDVVKQVEIEIKYAGYIAREKRRIETAGKQEGLKIPAWVDYDQIKSLRYEAREKLKKIQPENLGQASRISGVNPTDTTILSMWIKRGPDSE